MYNNSVEDAFKVYTDNGILKYTREGRLYTYEPSDKYLSSVAAMKGMQHDSTTTGTDSETFCAIERSLSDSTDVNSSFDFLITKEGNRDGYTDKQYEYARQAWKLYLNTGGGGIDNFKHYMHQNLVQNCPITNDDINRAQKILCTM